MAIAGYASWGEIAAASAVMALGGAMQRVIGFGVVLVAVAPLAFLDDRLVPGPLLVAAGTISICMAWWGRELLRWNEVVPSAFGLAIGSAIAAGILAIMPRDNLPYAFGIMILVAVGASISGFKFPFTPRSILAAGTAAGIMGTIAGPHGPPIALVYQHQSGEKVRAALGAFFSMASPITFVALHAVGRFGVPEVLAGLVLMPGMFFGYWVGKPLLRWIDQRRLRAGILALCAGSAVALILRG
jgi:uncharacterized protein